MKGLQALLLVLLGCAVYVETQLMSGNHPFSSIAAGWLVGWNMGELVYLRRGERINNVPSNS